MKLIASSLLLAAAGWLGLRPSAPAAAGTGACPEICPEDCCVAAECTDRGTCLVRCYDDDGALVCERELPCDAPCEPACDAPCPVVGACGG